MLRQNKNCETKHAIHHSRQESHFVWHLEEATQMMQNVHFKIKNLNLGDFLIKKKQKKNKKTYHLSLDQKGEG
jgi:hypothetical protein